MQTVNKEIWKTILMAPPSSGQIQTQAQTQAQAQAQASTKKKKSVAGMFYYVVLINYECFVLITILLHRTLPQMLMNKS